MSMPEYVTRELINMNIAKWRGTLEAYKEDALRGTPGLYEAVFCKHNQAVAATKVLGSCYPMFSEDEEVLIGAAKILVKEMPLTIDEKISVLASLREEPKAGQVLY